MSTVTRQKTSIAEGRDKTKKGRNKTKNFLIFTCYIGYGNTRQQTSFRQSIVKGILSLLR